MARNTTIAAVPTADDADQANVGELRFLDPKELVIEDNVRTEASETITKQFVQSVSEGVRVPLLAYENEDGQVVVWDGQRRTLAARTAELASVPVWVAPRTATTDTARTIERITDQVVTTERADLTPAQRVTAMHQLHLAGVSATKIAKTLHTDKRTVVDPALKAAASTTALTALDEQTLTLEQAAILAEYEDDEDATERLLAAAARGQFDYAAAQLAANVAERAAMKPVLDGYRAEGITATTIIPGYTDNSIRLDVLGVNDGQGDAPSIDDIPVDHRLAVVVAEVEQTWTDAEGNEVDADDIDWMLEGLDDDEDAEPEEGLLDPRTLTMTEGIAVETRWYVTDPDTLGLARRSYSYAARPLHSEDEPSEADKQAQRDERRQTVRMNKKALAATEVRREKISEFLARKTLPKGKAAAVAAFLADTMWNSHDLFGYNRQDANAKSLTMGLLGDKTPADAADGASAERRQIINLAIAVGAHEADMPKTAWRETGRSYTDHRATYLRMLVDVFGYTLTDVEQVIVGDLDLDNVDLDS